MSLRVASLATAATLSACSGSKPPVPPPAGVVDTAEASAEPPDEPHFACSFFWRKSVAHDHSHTETLAVRSGTRRVELHGFEVAATSDWTGKPRLELEIRMGDSALTSEHVFDGTPERMTEAGHGFTGLQYLTDDAGAELQYWCGAAGPGFDAEMDSLPGDDPPPPPVDDAGEIVLAPPELPTASVSCEASATTMGGKLLGPETFTVKPGGDHELTALAPFVFSVHSMASRYEGSALIVDASDSADATTMPTVHTLYQFGVSGPPGNTMVGPSFTGMQSLEIGGQTLRYRCWSDA
ncbi:MAG: hypothetical protein ACRBN8_30055 [Nannocystales bacterium]